MCGHISGIILNSYMVWFIERSVAYSIVHRLYDRRLSDIKDAITITLQRALRISCCCCCYAAARQSSLVVTFVCVYR